MVDTIVVLLVGFLIISILGRSKNAQKGKNAHTPKCESPIEWRMYNLLVRNGYNVVTQHKCGYYRIDMTIPEYKIAIECDGKAFHSSPSQKAYDAKRTSYLRRNGWKTVLRFSGSEICRNPDKVLKKIQKKIGSASR